MGPANLRGSRSSGRDPKSSGTMNKLFIITVLVALLAINTQGFRVARQAEEEGVAEAEPEMVAEEVVAEAPAEEIEAEAPAEEIVAEAPAEETEAEAPVEEVVAEAPVEEVPVEAGTMTKMTNAVKYYYSSTVDTATGYLDSIRGLKLEEKAKNMYDDTSRAMTTYAGIMQDQMYHLFWPSQDQ